MLVKIKFFGESENDAGRTEEFQADAAPMFTQMGFLRVIVDKREKNFALSTIAAYETDETKIQKVQHGIQTPGR